MDYKERNLNLFPHNITIQDCRDSIKDAIGFKEVHLEGTVSFVYDQLSDESFPDPNKENDQRLSFLLKVRRECRGIIFEESTNQLICRKLHKFFNVNESIECKAESINLNQNYLLTDKVDGSMIAPFRLNDKFNWGSKQGMTSFGKRMDEFVAERSGDIKYNEFAQHWVDRGYTPIFEYSASTQQIILYYGDEKLRLIAIRSMQTGEYIKYEEMLESCKEYGNIPIVDRIATKDHPILGKIKSMNEMVMAVKEMKNIEGFVIRFDNGTMYKIKTEWYIDLSRLSLQSPKEVRNEKDVWSIILAGNMDDTLSMIASQDNMSEKLVKIKQFSNILYKRIDECARIIIQFLINAKKVDLPRSKLASFDPTVRPQLIKFAYQFFDSTKASDSIDTHLSNVVEVLTSSLKKGCSSGLKLEYARQLIGTDIKFDYKPSQEELKQLKLHYKSGIDQDDLNN